MILLPGIAIGGSVGPVRWIGPGGPADGGVPSTAEVFSGCTNDRPLCEGPLHAPADATMYQVVTGNVSFVPGTVTSPSRSCCGYGAVGTLTGRCGVSSKPATAIHPRLARWNRHAGSFERMAHSAP